VSNHQVSGPYWATGQVARALLVGFLFLTSLAAARPYA
jgi:hypothetical protein